MTPAAILLLIALALAPCAEKRGNAICDAGALFCLQG
jgi:hypothetical protein